MSTTGDTAIGANTEQDAAAGDTVLALVGISKSYGPRRVLDDVHFDCVRGEVHALLGENGAGKSTLIKIASGALRPDQGSVLVGNSELPSTPRAARERGLLTAYQDTALVSDLTVEENMALGFQGVLPSRFLVPKREAYAMLAEFDVPFRAQDRVGSLSAASRQILEVLRCLVHRPHVLLLDEPTASLDTEHSQRLEVMLQRAKEHSGIVYISHRLDEVRRLADRLSVLRDGQLVAHWSDRSWQMDEVVNAMVGLPTELLFPELPAVRTSVCLKTADLRGPGFGPVNFGTREGEIVGIAGAEGNGQRELLRALAGLSRPQGSITVQGSDVKKGSVRSALRSGIRFLSGDRSAESIFRTLSASDNITIGLGKELGPSAIIVPAREREIFDKLRSGLQIAVASPDQPAGELSGGNQQKLVIGRGVAQRSSVLVIDEPTQGVDVNARQEIHRVIGDLAGQGTTVVVGSSDSAELAGLCHRVLVMSDGQIVAEHHGPRMSERDIVESFVNVERRADARGTQSAAEGPSWARKIVRSPHTPTVTLCAMILALGLFTATQSSFFLDSFNLLSILILALPLSIVAMGVMFTLLSADIDIAVGSTMSLTVAAMSHLVTGASLASSLPGIALVVTGGVLIGLAHAFIVRAIKVNPIIATIATLGIIQGLAIMVRPDPGGYVGSGLSSFVTSAVGFVPVLYIVVVVVAVVADMWLFRTSGGLMTRSVGFNEEACRRVGVRVTLIKTRAYVVCAVAASLAGVVLSVQTGQGTNSAGVGYLLPAVTACFLAGAVLTGGRGSFVITMLGALLLAMLINITPLLALPPEQAQVATGLLMLVAIGMYALRDAKKVEAR